MKHLVETVFRTEGVPDFTFVKAPNYMKILVDIRSPGKPVVVEGQSGTGKTTTVKKIIQDELPGQDFVYLSARKAADMETILAVAENRLLGKFIVDDFHRLADSIQVKLADLVKVGAEENDPTKFPKLVLIGINRVGSELINLVDDIAKRCGIHRILPASPAISVELIEKGEEKLRIRFQDKSKIINETRGDYWLTQLVCQSVCLMNNVGDTQTSEIVIDFDIIELRKDVVEKLEHTFEKPVKDFCRGTRFRASNDPYFKLLRCVGQQDSSIVDLTELANANPDVRGSINNVKEKRLPILIDSKESCTKYFYYNQETKTFALEDPALFYFVKHADWEEIRKKCGFRDIDREYEWDFAISFAGENRILARELEQQLLKMDCSVFLDESYESNYLGRALHKTFEEIFATKARFVICILDSFHREKIWPTFERETFVPRIADGSVIPIYLDNTKFVGIPEDLLGITFKDVLTATPDFSNIVTDKIVYKLIDRIDEV